jgi:hypothetical protein
MRLHTLTDYVNDRINLLKKFEADIAYAYVDSQGIATFGIGINLREHGELVLQALGFDTAGIRLQGAALDKEREYASL